MKSVEEVDDSDKCIICMDRVVNVKFKGCSHSMTCREGNEAQLGKDHEETKKCRMNLAMCFAAAGEKLKLRKIIDKYPHIMIDHPAFKDDL